MGDRRIAAWGSLPVAHACCHVFGPALPLLVHERFGGSRRRPCAAGVVAWKATPPGPTVPKPSVDPASLIPAVPPGTPPCRASQLEGIRRAGSGYTGAVDVPVDVRNRSNTPCYLEGWTTVSALDSAGRVVATATVGDGQIGPFPTVRVLMTIGTPALTPDVVSSSPGVGVPPASAHLLGQARLNIIWEDCDPPVTGELAIDLASGGGRLLVASELCCKSERRSRVLLSF